MATAWKWLIGLKRLFRSGLTPVDCNTYTGTPVVLLGQGDYRRAYAPIGEQQ